MAYAASQPVKEVPGFARVGQAVRKGVLAALNPIFGTPENPTKLGRAMALAEEASQYGLSVGPAAAVGRVRYNPHPVRGTRIVDKRFLGDMTIPLQNRQAASSVVVAPKSMFSNSPGNMVLITEHNGQVILPREADVRLYSSERVVLPDGRKVKLEELPSIVSDLDASSMSREAKQKEVAQLNAAVTPQWMYRMYQKDMADLRATLKAHRAGNRFYDNEGIKMYDVLSRGDAASIIGEPVGTKFQMRTKDLGNITFSPNHVSDMTHDRFVKDPRLYEAYNDGFLPYQSLSFLGSPYTVRGKTVTPVLRVTDHHEMLRDATGSLLRPGTAGLSIPEYREYKRTYNVGRDIPYFGIKPVEPGGVDLMYHLDNGQNVIRANGAYSASVAVQQASKGGDSPHRNFRNFLASDKVPESIFGYRVVQRTEDYTPEDVEFFRANPKAAGFYDTGNEEMAEDIPQQAVKSKPTRGKYPGLTNNPGNVEKHELRTDKTLFEGEDGGGVRPKRFARFTDPVLGLKASATVLARKADELAKARKPFTIENYAPLYAPPNENDTEAYIKNLSAYSGIPRDMDIDRWDTERLAKLLKAKVRFETSPEASRWFTDEEYEEAAEKLQEGVFD